MKTSYNNTAKRQVRRDEPQVSLSLGRIQDSLEETLERLARYYITGPHEAIKRFSLCCGSGQFENLEDRARTYCTVQRPTTASIITTTIILLMI